MKVFSISSFGFNCDSVSVETDLRRGIPSIDIVGISDASVKNTREMIMASFNNSLLDFQNERILISLSPADLKKNGTEYTLAIALSILDAQKPFDVDEVCVFGELDVSGKIVDYFPSNNRLYNKVKSAIEMGFTKFIVPEFCEWIDDFESIEFIKVSSLKDAEEKLRNKKFKMTIKNELKERNSSNIVFPEITEETKNHLNELLKKYPHASRAVSIAIAGKLNILAYGAPGCGKTMLLQGLIPYLTPYLTFEELESVKRLYSIAGMKYTNEYIPFRMPHQTASIEGMCGGGINCNPGEISLAHNGVLFLDEAAEFKTSVLQMLRVPLESGCITLSRAGRITIYPAKFQLAMAVNPCPCGNYGEKDKICLCSAKAVEMYWKKFSAPLLDRIQIKIHFEKDESGTGSIPLEKVKEQIENAYRIQRENGCYNRDIPASKLDEYTKENTWINNKSKDLTERAKYNVIKTAITIANMDNRTEINESDWDEAYKLQSFSEIQFI